VWRNGRGPWRVLLALGVAAAMIGSLLSVSLASAGRPTVAAADHGRAQARASIVGRSGNSSSPSVALLHCRARLKRLTDEVAFGKRLEADVRAGRTYLIRDSGGNIAHVSKAELTQFLTLEVLEGAVKPGDVAATIGEIKQETAGNLNAFDIGLHLILGEAKSQQVKCNALKSGKPPTSTPPPPKAGTFVLDPSKTEVQNPDAPATTIDAGGMTAEWNHTGQYGGAGNGGDWDVKYTWHVPTTLTAGQHTTITVGLTVSNVNPVQPQGFSIGAAAPDFTQTLDVQYPSKSADSVTYEVPIAADQASSKEILITIGFVSDLVVYHYEPAG